MYLCPNLIKSNELNHYFLCFLYCVEVRLSIVFNFMDFFDELFRFSVLFLLAFFNLCLLLNFIDLLLFLLDSFNVIVDVLGMMKLIRPIALVLSVLAILVGAIWILQGVNILPGSFMTGDFQWSIRGAVLALVGGLGLWRILRKPSA